MHWLIDFQGRFVTFDTRKNFHFYFCLLYDHFSCRASGLENIDKQLNPLMPGGNIKVTPESCRFV